MVQHVFAGFRTASGNDVQHAFRQQVVNFLGERQQAQRSAGRRVNDDGTACGKCGRDFPSRHQEGEVPRNDLTDYADRFAQYDRQIFGVKLGCGAFFAADDAGEITEMVGSQRDVGGAGFTDGFAVVQRFLQGEQFQVFVNHISDFVEYGGTFGCGGLAPCFECFLRGGDSGIDIGVGRVGEFRQYFAVGRIVRIQKRAGFRPHAVNQEAVLFIKHI